MLIARGATPGLKSKQQFVRVPKLNKEKNFLSDETANKEIETGNNFKTIIIGKRKTLKGLNVNSPGCNPGFKKVATIRPRTEVEQSGKPSVGRNSEEGN